MVVRQEDMVQRPLNFALVDEVDSVLIDEARTPLIVSGQVSSETSQLYIRADRFVKTLTSVDYAIDVPTKTIGLTDYGIDKAEEYFHLENLYDLENVALTHYIDNALRANYIMLLDIDYVVSQMGEILIVDQFTGRTMEGRRFSDGLHQAIEAKEGVAIQEESKTSASITYQNMFRMYKKLAGMTGTAKQKRKNSAKFTICVSFQSQLTNLWHVLTIQTFYIQHSTLNLELLLRMSRLVMKKVNRSWLVLLRWKHQTLFLRN